MSHTLRWLARCKLGSAARKPNIYGQAKNLVCDTLYYPIGVITPICAKNWIWSCIYYFACPDAKFTKGKENMRGLEIVAAFTLSALALYWFVGQSDKSSKLIESLAKGYTQTVGTLMGN